MIKTIDITLVGNEVNSSAENKVVTVDFWNQPLVIDWDDIQDIPTDLVQDSEYVHTDNNFTDEDEAKLDGIEAGAEVNVQADWTETDPTSDAYILHKPDGKVFGGVITPLSAAPSTPDPNVFFVAFEQGDYTNFDDFYLGVGNMAIVTYSNSEWQADKYTYDKIGYIEVNTESGEPLDDEQLIEMEKTPCFAKDQQGNFYYKSRSSKFATLFTSVPIMEESEGVITIHNSTFSVSNTTHTILWTDGTVLTYSTTGTQSVVDTAIQEAQVGASVFQGTTDLADNATVTGEHWKFSTIEDYKKGQYWVVASAGTYAGKVCEAGDMIFCVSDKGNAYSANDFSAVQNNIETISNNDIDTIMAN